MTVRIDPVPRHGDIPPWKPSVFWFNYITLIADLQEQFAQIQGRWAKLRSEAGNQPLSHDDASSRIHSRYPTDCALLSELEAQLSVDCYSELCFGEIGLLVDRLIFRRQFIAFRCGECGAQFGAGDAVIKPWMIGESLAAMGGEKLCCPFGHTVYAAEQWNS
ncbi:MAG: hypothetical protein H8F28_15015 [Fibrella sp.]|nr:hypothetical protein [Armatimonadota bacterium]